MNAKRIRDRIMDAVTIIASVGAVATAVASLRRQPAERTTGAAIRDTAVTVRNWPALIAEGRRLGPTTASLTILEFGDFECPSCGGFERTLRSVRRRYPAEIAVVFRHWPLPYHRFAYPTARAAECAALQGRFEAFHDLAYERQDSLGLISFSALAARAGVSNLQAFNSCNQETGKVAAIERDITAAKALDSPGTPTIVVNGQMLRFVPDSFQIEALLKRAKQDRTGS